MTKTIKVQYSTRYTGRRYSEVPKTRCKANGLMLAGSVLF